MRAPGAAGAHLARPCPGRQTRRAPVPVVASRPARMTPPPAPGMYRVALALAALCLAGGIGVMAAQLAGRTTSSFGGTLATVGMLFILLAVAVRRRGP